MILRSDTVSVIQAPISLQIVIAYTDSINLIETLTIENDSQKSMGGHASNVPEVESVSVVLYCCIHVGFVRP